MEWTRGSVIGRGASATVSLATTVSGDLFAVKSTNLSCSSSLQLENHFLSQLNSPYIVKYMGFDITCESNQPMYNLFMEYAPGGTLFDAIKRHGGSLDEPMIRFYTSHVVQGLDYLHLNGLVHCDIKGQNILIGKDGAKIGDLGCARFVEDGGVAKGMFAGTPVFMAPEVARGEEQGFPADVWALGCTIIEMATGSNPWPEVNDPVSALYRIGFSGDVPEFPRWLSEDAKDFLSKCLKIDSKERWTAKQLLQHPFLHDLEMSSEKLREFNKNSPIDVLDQCFWDSLELLEDSEPHRNLTHMGSSSNLPAERIRRLIGGTSSLGSNLPNWSWDEDWITVRSNQIEENIKFSEENRNMNTDDRELMNTELFMSSIVLVEEVDYSIVVEDLLLECYIFRISTIDGLSDRIDFVMSCESTKTCFCVMSSKFRKLMKFYCSFHAIAKICFCRGMTLDRVKSI
ncbi:mitogen-activated protein kinase kinase kinase 18 [Cornus florida]|uniref:mitogen-activated protein kinase kinase kinase 18 n=1 Tax=Cornus florida TaxID=4283 RepID=UPI0028A26566|nr:mitogen-activated protein kinase kinase kinase 18 [Cornus florida]